MSSESKLTLQIKMTSPTQALTASDSNVLASPVKARSKQQGEGFAQTLSATVRASRSAYVPRGESYSLAKHGSHRVGDIELVPGAPGYDFQKALPYLKEIAGRDKDLASYLNRQGIADPLGEPVNPIVIELSAEDQAYLDSLEQAEFTNQTLAQTNDDTGQETGETESENVEPMDENPVEVAQQDPTEQTSQDVLAEVHLGVLAEISGESSSESSSQEELFSLTELLATQDYLKQRTQQEAQDLLSALITTTS